MRCESRIIDKRTGHCKCGERERESESESERESERERERQIDRKKRRGSQTEKDSGFSKAKSFFG